MKIRNVLSTIILVLVLSLTVGFSAFVSEMSISEIVADVRVQKDVRITGVEMIEGNAISKSLDYTANSVFGSFSPSSDDTTLAQYKVTITNFGNVDINLAACYVEELSGGYFECIDGCDSEIISGLGNSHEMFFQIENSENTDSYFKIIVEFKEIFSVSFENINISDDIATYDSIYYIYVGSEFKKTDFKVYMGGVLVSDDVWDVIDGELYVYGVYDNLVIERVEKVAKLVSGDLTTVGSEVCIKDECFYIINNDGSNVTMLAKYNLLVGNKYDDVNGTVPLENPTGIQNEKAIGWFEGYSVDNPIIGSKPFSLTNYWSASVSSYPAYVYNEKSNVYIDVENYKTYLNGLGGNIIDARLIKLSELERLGCNRTTGTCISTYDWLYSTTYWTGEAGESTDFWRIYSNGALGGSNYSLESRGVRPVIEMSVDEIVGPISFTVDGVTYLAADGMTWAEWIESDYNTSNTVCDSSGRVQYGGPYGRTLLKDGAIVYASDEVVANVTYLISEFHSGGAL